MAQPFDVARLKLTGEPFLAASEVALAGSVVAVSVSHSGVLVLSSDTNPGLNTQLAWFNRDGKPLDNAAPTDRYQDFSLAPDGKRMVVALRSDLWLLDLTTSGLTHFTFDPVTDRFPVWSPDGTRIVYTRALAYLYEKMVDGTGERQLMGVLGRPMDWSPNGHSILVRGNDGDLWALTDGKPVRITQTPFNESHAQFSPDGNWLALASDETGQSEVYVQAFPAAGERLPISTGGGIEPRWRGDGKELFYVAPENKLMAVSVNAGAGFHHAAPKHLFDLPAIRRGDFFSFDYIVDRSGQRFLVRAPAEASKPVPITVMMNWRALAKK